MNANAYKGSVTIYCKFGRHTFPGGRLTTNPVLCFGQVHVHKDGFFSVVNCTECVPLWHKSRDGAIEEALFHAVEDHDYGDWCSTESEEREILPRKDT